MPCRDYMDDRDYYHTELKARTDTLTQLLCRLCGRIEELGPKDYNVVLDEYLIKGDKELAAWWTEHKKKDAERIAKEKAEQERKRTRKLALAKLTNEEREALGIPLPKERVRRKK